jgi:hypothetical protein
MCVKIIGNLLLLAVIVAVISFFAAPAVAFFAIRSAADANDAAALARLIDYPAVRQSLRPQLAGNPAAQAPAPSFLEDPIGAVRRQFEPGTVASEDVDAYLTPAAIGALTRGEGRFARQRTAAAASRSGDPMPTPVYWGVNRARLGVSDEGGSRTIFTFERRGPFQWRLAHIGLPDGASPPAAPPPPAAAPAPTGRKAG